MNLSRTIPTIFLPFILVFFLFSCSSPKPDGAQSSKSSTGGPTAADSAVASEFNLSDLMTDFSKHSVPTDQIYDGGVSKNGIPAIDFPEFINLKDAGGFLTELDYGILLNVKNDVRFYPFNILNWHEIVNDIVGGVPVAVTFCPLCGSGIVYERIVDGDTLDFGVSGKLYESNLLMFDNRTESLWSQAMGEALVGQFTGKKLKLINSVVVSYEEIETDYPAVKILSPNTGFDRNYTRSPYADYISTEELYFPIANKSDQFTPKNMMYVVVSNGERIAFDWLSLLKKGSASVTTSSGNVQVTVKKNVPYATLKGESLPGYFTFWFSWYTHFGATGKVWPAK